MKHFIRIVLIIVLISFFNYPLYGSNYITSGLDYVTSLVSGPKRMVIMEGPSIYDSQKDSCVLAGARSLQSPDSCVLQRRQTQVQQNFHRPRRPSSLRRSESALDDDFKNSSVSVFLESPMFQKNDLISVHELSKEEALILVYAFIKTRPVQSLHEVSRNKGICIDGKLYSPFMLWKKTTGDMKWGDASFKIINLFFNAAKCEFHEWSLEDL